MCVCVTFRCCCLRESAERTLSCVRRWRSRPVSPCPLALKKSPSTSLNSMRWELLLCLCCTHAPASQPDYSFGMLGRQRNVTSNIIFCFIGFETPARQKSGWQLQNVEFPRMLIGINDVRRHLRSAQRVTHLQAQTKGLVQIPKQHKGETFSQSCWLPCRPSDIVKLPDFPLCPFSSAFMLELSLLSP